MIFNNSDAIEQVYNAAALKGIPCEELCRAMAVKLIRDTRRENYSFVMTDIQTGGKNSYTKWKNDFVPQMIATGMIHACLSLLDGMDAAEAGIKSAASVQARESMQQSLTAQKDAFFGIVCAYINDLDFLIRQGCIQPSDRWKVYRIALESVREYRDGLRAMTDPEPKGGGTDGRKGTEAGTGRPEDV